MTPEYLFSSDNFLYIAFWLFLAVAGRYLLVAGLFFAFFYGIQSLKWQPRRINTTSYRQGQIAQEITWSVVTSAIFAISGALTILLWRDGKTAIYKNIDDYGFIYFFISIILAMLIHETYYYWLHRWMHLPKIFPLVHKIHHTSLVTSPWTAFSFHPWEALIQALFLPLLVILLPLNAWAILIYLTVMTLSSVINHLNIEIGPQWILKSWLGRLLISATHHSLHHTQLKYNFGLYFRFWDQWLGTESPLLINSALLIPTREINDKLGNG